MSTQPIMSTLYYSFIIFACVFLLSCAILCVSTVVYLSSRMLSEVYSLYIDYKIIQINKTNIYRLESELENERD